MSSCEWHVHAVASGESGGGAAEGTQLLFSTFDLPPAAVSATQEQPPSSAHLAVYDGHSGALLRSYFGSSAACDPKLRLVCSGNGVCVSEGDVAAGLPSDQPPYNGYSGADVQALFAAAAVNSAFGEAAAGVCLCYEGFFDADCSVVKQAAFATTHLVLRWHGGAAADSAAARGRGGVRLRFFGIFGCPSTEASALLSYADQQSYGALSADAQAAVGAEICSGHGHCFLGQCQCGSGFESAESGCSSTLRHVHVPPPPLATCCQPLRVQGRGATSWHIEACRVVARRGCWRRRCGRGQYAECVGEPQAFGRSSDVCSCETCPTGRYGADGRNCEDCELGKFSRAGQRECWACRPGSYADAASQTEGYCKLCAKGQYSAFPGASECTSCTAGTYHMLVLRLTRAETACHALDEPSMPPALSLTPWPHALHPHVLANSCAPGRPMLRLTRLTRHIMATCTAGLLVFGRAGRKL